MAENSRYDSFNEWSAKFAQSRLGDAVLSELRKLSENADSSLQSRFREEVLRACYYAFRFWYHGDVNSEKRELLRDISDFKDDLHSLLESTIHQIDFLRPIHDALVTEGAREFFENDQIESNPSISLDDLIFHLELYRLGIDRFQQKTLPTHDSRDECWVYGNMRYPKRIDGEQQHRMPHPSTCLIFQLAVFFRLWTHPEGQRLFDTSLSLAIPKEGMAMPKDGKRHAPLIETFVKATFDNPALVQKVTPSSHDKDYEFPNYDMATKSSVVHRLDKIDPNIRLQLWHDESFDVMTIPQEVVARMKKKIRKID